MNTAVKVKGSLVGKFPNSLHLGFHESVVKVLTPIASFTLEPTWQDIKDRYEAKVETLVDYNTVSTTYAETPKLVELDAERNRLLSLLFLMIDNALLSKNTTTLEAARAVSAKISTYKGIQALPYDAKTSKIHGLLLDLNKSILEEHLATLHLDVLVSPLEKANDDYEELRDKKRAIKTDRQNSPKTKDIRQEVDDMFNDICNLLVALQILGGEADRHNAELLVVDINGVVDHYRQTYNQMQGQKTDAEEPEQEEESGGTQFEPITPEGEEAAPKEA